jgi:Family of unknown function (DUF6263)
MRHSNRRWITVRTTIRLRIAVFVLYLVTGSVNGDDTVDGGKADIRWKAFEKTSKPFYQVLTTRTTQRMRVKEEEFKQDQEQTFVVKWTPGDEDSKGNWVVKQQIIGIKMLIDIGGGKISYDSADRRAPKSPMTAFFEALQSAEFKFHINPLDFSVLQIEGREETLQKLSRENPQLEVLLKSILSEPALKQMAEQPFDVFPPEAVRKDWTVQHKRWKRERLLDLGPIGVYKTDMSFTWDRKDKIKIESKIAYNGPADKTKNASLPFTIKEGNLGGKDLGNSYAVFDRNRGRFKEIRIAIALRGTLKIDIDGKETTITLDQTQTSTAESFDENPLAKTEKK